MDSGPLLAEQNSNAADMSVAAFSQLSTDESVEPLAQNKPAATEALLNQSLELQPMTPTSTAGVDEDAKIAQLKSALAEGVRAHEPHVR